MMSGLNTHKPGSTEAEGSREEFLTAVRAHRASPGVCEVDGIVIVVHEHTIVFELADDTLLTFDATELRVRVAPLASQERRAAA